MKTRTSTRASKVLWGCALGCAGALGCLDLIGYRDHVLGDPNAEGGGGSAAGGGGGASTSMSSGGSGGICEPGAMVECYSGPAGTEKVGICKTGLQSCDTDGIPAGPCNGEKTPLAETCATTSDDDCDGSDCAIWSQLFVGQNNTFLSFEDIAVDDEGHLVVLGAFNGTIKIGATELLSGQSTSLLLFRLSPKGDVVWAKALGDSAANEVTAQLALDPQSNVVLAGSFSGSMKIGAEVLTSMDEADVFVAKLDSAGVPVWSYSYPGAGSVSVTDVACSKFGDIAVLGQFAGGFKLGDTTLDSAGMFDLFVAKLSSSGIATWSKRFGDASSQYAAEVEFDSSGNVFLAGLYEGVLNFGGDDLISDPNNEFADIYVAKLGTMDGGHGWSKTFVAESPAYVHLAVGPSAEVVLAGQYQGLLDFGEGAHVSVDSSDIFMAKFDFSGDLLWSKSFGDAGGDGVSSVSIGKDDAILLAASILLGSPAGAQMNFGGPNLSKSGLALAKFDVAGEHLWSRSFGEDCFKGIFPAMDDGELVGCQLVGSVDFGGGVLATQRFSPMKYYPGIAVAKLAP